MENHSDISKNFIPYDLALELKELGFKEECLAVYCGESNIRFRILEKNTFINDKSSWVTAPLWQQAFDWFREKNYMEGHPYISYNLPPKATWGYSIQTSEPKYIKSLNSHYSTYEEARQACLEKLIEIAKEQNVK